MDLGFSGEVVELYRRYRHGYPPEVVEQVLDLLGVAGDDLAVDLGCGTGQLTLPLAAGVRAAVGVDPEADMLSEAHRQAKRVGATNVAWLLGSDRSLSLITSLLGARSIGVLTVAQALHWMDHRQLFAEAQPLIRPGGGVAILSNGVPLWLHATDWGLDLRAFLEQWLDTTITARCGTDPETQRGYVDDLRRAGYVVSRFEHEYTVQLDFDRLAGGVLSALPVSRLPTGARREEFMDGLRAALGSADRFSESVPVVVLVGRL